MAAKRQRVAKIVHPMTAEEIAVIKDRIGAALHDDPVLAAKFDGFIDEWSSVQKASAEKDLRLSQLRRSLFLAMGIVPSSEKQKSTEPKVPGARKGAKPRGLEEKLGQDLQKARQRAAY